MKYTVTVKREASSVFYVDVTVEAVDVNDAISRAEDIAQYSKDIVWVDDPEACDITYETVDWEEVK